MLPVKLNWPQSQWPYLRPGWLRPPDPRARIEQPARTVLLPGRSQTRPILARPKSLAIVRGLEQHAFAPLLVSARDGHQSVLLFAARNNAKESGRVQRR